jgi:hypothetical protein
MFQSKPIFPKSFYLWFNVIFSRDFKVQWYLAYKKDNISKGVTYIFTKRMLVQNKNFFINVELNIINKNNLGPKTYFEYFISNNCSAFENIVKDVNFIYNEV